MKRQTIGKSVGVIVRNAKREYLVLWRLKEPTGLALPAGHVDEGEDPKGAARRELYEETGLAARDLKKVFSGRIPAFGRAAALTHCGHASHDWWVYEATAEGEPSLKEPLKHKFVKFMPLEAMWPHIQAMNCDSAWFAYIFPALGIVI